MNVVAYSASGMSSSTWHDGLVEAFPIPNSDSDSINSDQEEDASTDSDEGEDSHRPNDLNITKRRASRRCLLFTLPAELRNRVYKFVLFSASNATTSSFSITAAGPKQKKMTKYQLSRQLHRRRQQPNDCLQNLPTSLFLTSSQIHAEASYIFYSQQPVHLFPLQKFPPHPPTLTSLPPHYRKHVKNLQLILGPSWTSPPPSWAVTKTLARVLSASSVPLLTRLHVIVEIDPSHPQFRGFRVHPDFYTNFAGELLKDVLAAMHKCVSQVHISHYCSVQPDGPLITKLIEVVKSMDRKVILSASAA